MATKDFRLRPRSLMIGVSLLSLCAAGAMAQEVDESVRPTLLQSIVVTGTGTSPTGTIG